LEDLEIDVYFGQNKYIDGYTVTNFLFNMVTSFFVEKKTWLLVLPYLCFSIRILKKKYVENPL